MIEVKVKKFADVRSDIGTYTHWYEDEQGNRNKCDEYTINFLWEKWLISNNPTRDIEQSTNIMIFDKPFKIII